MLPRISSFGYIVVTVDHPYDADIVVFPDNSTILGLNIETEDQILASLNTRTKDISFVINQLSRPSITRKFLPALALGGIDVSKVGIYGHSLGGATAAEAMLYDKRLVGGVNLDGTFFGDVVKEGLDRPFLIFAHEGKNRSTDSSWEAIWPKLRGWKKELMLNGSAHGTFTDLPDVLDVLGIGGSLPSEVEELLGSIDGARALEIVTLYVRTFFDFVLKGKNSKVLDGPSKDYPEVEFDSA
jgi:dienelactone hydrolase